jgi:peroxiredoxin 5
MRDANIDEVLVICVNDGATMGAWAKDQKIEGSNIVFLGDPNSVVTRALDLELTNPGPCADLGPGRCKRFAMFVEDGVIKVINVSEAPDDPAGDARPEASCAENMLKCIAAL